MQFKTIAKFCGLSLAIYLLLVATPWSGPRRAYARFYRSVHAVAFHRIGEKGEVRFESLVPKQGTTFQRLEDDMDIVMTVPGAGKAARSTSTWTRGYVPVAMLITLILATPVSWNRKLGALLIGLAVLHAIFLLRMWVSLRYSFTCDLRGTALAQFDATTWFGRILPEVYAFMCLAPEPNFLLPPLIWLFVTFRKDDWSRLLAAAGQRVRACEGGERTGEVPRPGGGKRRGG